MAFFDVTKKQLPGANGRTTCNINVKMLQFSQCVINSYQTKKCRLTPPVNEVPNLFYTAVTRCSRHPLWSYRMPSFCTAPAATKSAKTQNARCRRCNATLHRRYGKLGERKRKAINFGTNYFLSKAIVSM